MPTIANRGGADRLVGVSSTAGMAMLHANDSRATAWRGCGCSRDLPIPADGDSRARARRHPRHADRADGAARRRASESSSTLRFAAAGERTVDGRGRRAGRALMLGKLRIVLWGAGAGRRRGARLARHSRPRRRCPSRRSTELPLASIGGPFTLVGGDGQPFSSTQAGRQAVRDLLRLHPLPRRLPDDAGAAGQAAPRSSARATTRSRSSSSASIPSATARPRSAPMPNCSARR